MEGEKNMRQAFFNGNIITMNDAQPKAEALLLEDGVIVAVGSNEEILDQRGDASLIDLGQFTVLPGFIDCHSYFCTSYAFPRFDPSPHRALPRAYPFYSIRE